MFLALKSKVMTLAAIGVDLRGRKWIYPASLQTWQPGASAAQHQQKAASLVMLNSLEDVEYPAGVVSSLCCISLCFSIVAVFMGFISLNDKDMPSRKIDCWSRQRNRNESCALLGSGAIFMTKGLTLCTR